MKEFRLIIAGTRTFTDYETLKAKALEFIQSRADGRPVTIISGGSKGADKLAEKFADDMGFRKEVVRANWALGRGAGPERNTRMSKMANALLAFWDYESAGTHDMITKAKKQGLGVKIVKV